MRINHNISAMNSYRNFSSNTSKLSKNLEKLSTGLKINRAGDDAAGLAISEKMRVQISGLEAATKNAKDGISLVQTAEGALTEVHDMLNRMVTLAEQSANGTYDDDVDRNQLQKEVDALKSEIDRIADSTNYNGIKLLDGSLAGGAGATGVSSTAVTGFKLADSAALKGGVGSYKTEAFQKLAAAPASGDQITMELNYTDRLGKEQKFSVTITVGSGTKGTFVTSDGESGKISGLGASATKQAAAFKAALTAAKKFSENFAVSAAAGVLTFTSKEAGANTAKIAGGPGSTGVITISHVSASGTTKTAKADLTQTDSTQITAGVDRTTAYNFTASRTWNIASNTKVTAEELASKAFTVGGKKFVFISGSANTSIATNAKAANLLKEAGIDGYIETAASATTGVAAADVTRMVKKIEDVTGLDLEQGAATAWKIAATATGVTFTASTTGTGFYVVGSNQQKDSASGGLTLQIGDTSDSFNRMTVSIEDMHSKSIGVGNVDISTQEGATTAIDNIKSAVNFVSNTRGTLGALQNRLDHTINNLGVMRENIQSSESLIRDTDVAEEMMTYTKNNILNQSAQAMLAQANQLPQGVLQLLG